jgi:DNA primase
MNTVEEIKARLDIVDLISEYISLKKAGRNYKGRCPFHAEKTPSFVVFPDSQRWHCFGACGTGGDIFTFVMKQEGMEFADALRVLARRAGVELAPRSEAATAEEKRLERLREVNAVAATYFHNLLLHADEAVHARDYLARRKINADTVQLFQLGYALDSWEALKTYLLERGYNIEEIVEAGLVVEREGKRGHYDRFRGRLIIPIRDRRGRNIGFGARALPVAGVRPDDEPPKYINSPQTPIFDKSRVLYGLDVAARAIRAADQVIIVEGYMDVLQAHQHGVANVVASMGTALTAEHFKTIRRLTPNFVLALDADQAGDQATLRGLALARETLGGETLPVKGGASFESPGNADIRILTLPTGQDPDDVIRRDVEEWSALVQQATPLVDYYFKTQLADLDLHSARGKREAFNRLAPVLAELRDTIERAHYVQKLASLIQVDEPTLFARLKNWLKRKRPAAPPGVLERVTLSKELPEYGLEAYCLSLLLGRPALLAKVKALTDELEIEPLGPADFSDTQHQALFDALQAAAADFAADAFRASLEETLAARFDALLERADGQPPAPDERLEKNLGDAVLRLRRRRVQERNQQLKQLQADARATGDHKAAEYEELVQSQAATLRRIDGVLGMRSNMERLRLEEKTGVMLDTNG